MSGIVFLCHIFGSLARESNSGETFVRFFSVFRFIWDGQTRGKIYVNCGFMRTKSRVKDKTNWIVSVWGLLRLGGDQRASKEGSLHWWDLRVSSSEQSDIFWISVREWSILHFLDLCLELTTKRMLNFLVSPTAQMGRLLSRQEGRIEMKRKIVKLWYSYFIPPKHPNISIAAWCMILSLAPLA